MPETAPRGGGTTEMKEEIDWKEDFFNPQTSIPSKRIY